MQFWSNQTLWQSIEVNRNPSVFSPAASSQRHALFWIQFSRWEKNYHHFFSLDAFYLLQSTDSRNFGQVKRYGNPPQIIATLSFCLLSTSYSLLYSIFKVRHISDQPLCSSWRVLYVAINRQPQFRKIKVYGNPPQANKYPIVLFPPHAIICAGFILKVRNKFDQPLCSSLSALSDAIDW